VLALHRWLGLVGGIFLLVIVATGIVLLFESEIEAVHVPPGVHRKGYDVLWQTIQQTYPDAQPGAWHLYSQQPGQAMRADISSKGTRLRVYQNPYTGEIVKVVEGEAWVHQTKELHEALLIGFPGHLIMGLVGLCLLGSAVTGFIYYRTFIFQVFSVGIRWNKNSYIVNSDIHKLLGVCALLFMLLMSATGMFFHWEAVERRMGGGPPVRNQSGVASQPPPISLDAALIVAQNAVDGFSPELIQFPRNPTDNLRIQGVTPVHSRLFGKFDVSVAIDANGAVKEVFRTSEADAEFKAEHLFEELHFGQYGGLFTKILYALFALATAVVTVTGFAIWWKKK
jgi:uncharacterized iron-regulated membrane protein